MDTTTAHQVPLSLADRRALLAAASLGLAGEALAARHLREDHRLRIVATNWRVVDGPLRGELDLIALDPPTGSLVVCEVKTRRDAGRFGGATAAVDPRKHQRLRALTGAFLRDQPARYASVRLDLIAIDVGCTPRLTHLVGLD